MCRKVKLEHLLIPDTRLNSKWVQDLNVRPQTKKILEENKVVNFSTLLIAVFFLTYLLRQEKQNKKINKWDYIKFKRNLHSKENHQQNKKTTPTEWENIFTDISGKELISKIYKERIKLNTKKPHTIQLKNGQVT